MKKILKQYKKVHIRPIIYCSTTRGPIALAAALVWDRFVGPKSFLSVKRDIFFLIALIFFGLAWIHYLRLDGIDTSNIKEEFEETKPKKKKKPIRFSYGDIIDFVDEHVVTMDELSDEEQHLCKLATNVLLGGVFMLISFFFI